MSTEHKPVMAAELVEWLQPQPGNVMVDATLGGGGHTVVLAERVAPEGTVVAVDRDPLVTQRARQRIWPARVVPVLANYADLAGILQELGIPAVQGIVMDLGLSSDQLADAPRGFSFRVDGPLDLRFNPDEGDPAWALLARLTEVELARMIFEFGEERFSRRIARRIVEQRRRGEPIRTSRQLADLVRSCYPRRPVASARRHAAIDPATRTFQALRIAVNRELDHLQSALKDYPNLLTEGGRLAVISFHSLEDRIVKQAFRDDPRWEVLTRKPQRPTAEEIARNPRSRSAKLRVAARASPVGQQH